MFFYYSIKFKQYLLTASTTLKDAAGASTLYLPLLLPPFPSGVCSTFTFTFSKLQRLYCILQLRERFCMCTQVDSKKLKIY